MVLPSAAMNLNNAAAIWFTSNSSKYCLNSLEKTTAALVL
jgi:hypothetical protein